MAITDACNAPLLAFRPALADEASRCAAGRPLRSGVRLHHTPARVDNRLESAGLVRGEPTKRLRPLVQCRLVCDQSPDVHPLSIHELNGARIDVSHAARELHSEAAAAGFRG